MNEEAQEIFDRLVKMNPEELNKDEIIFLNARSPYLNNEQKRIFASVLTKTKDSATVDDVDENGIYIAKKDRK